MTNILMPALSPTMEEGKLARWLVKEGDTVKSGDILAEIETDKAVMEFEAVDEGRIGKILVPEGSEGVKVNQPIAELIGEDGDAAAPGTPAPDGVDISSAMQSIKDAIGNETKKPAAKKAEKAPARPAVVSAQAVAPPASQPRGNGHAGRVFASPLARKLASQSGVDIAAVSGTGPRGRIVKSDIEAAQKSGVKVSVDKSATASISTAAAPPGSPSGLSLPDARLFYGKDQYDEIPHDSMRKAIARRLTAAKSLIPHYYLTIDCHIDALLATRTRLNGAAPKGEGGFKLSVNDFIVKASAAALMRVPEVNASWTESGMLRHRHADVGVAVALDFGLITPIVFRADEKGLVAISNEVKSLAERARAKKLKPQEYEGGGFSVSNLGMFGIREFTAVINPPQSAILAVGAAETRAVARGGKIEAATVMTVTMSCDHRVIDGATGARFLQAFRTFIEEPSAMLL